MQTSSCSMLRQPSPPPGAAPARCIPTLCSGDHICGPALARAHWAHFFASGRLLIPAKPCPLGKGQSLSLCGVPLLSPWFLRCPASLSRDVVDSTLVYLSEPFYQVNLFMGQQFFKDFQFKLLVWFDSTPIDTTLTSKDVLETGVIP